jgi:pimeloyl-ACP methyl ester carboxylesterase
VLFDQRGCGRSSPHASLNDNTTWLLLRARAGGVLFSLQTAFKYRQEKKSLPTIHFVDA